MAKRKRSQSLILAQKETNSPNHIRNHDSTIQQNFNHVLLVDDSHAEPVKRARTSSDVEVDESRGDISKSKPLTLLSREALGGYINTDFKWAWSSELKILHPVFGTPLGELPGLKMWDPRKQLEMICKDAHKRSMYWHRYHAKQVETTKDKIVARKPFGFFALPSELRNQVYELASLDSLSKDRTTWKSNPILGTSQRMRKEFLNIYASLSNFNVKVADLNRFFNMLHPDFARRLKAFTVTFPQSCAETKIFDMYPVYKLKCCAAPKCKIAFIYGGLSSIEQRKLSVNVKAFDKLVARVHQEAISETLSSNMITSIYFDADGRLTRVTARHGLWLTYQDLKTALGSETDFALTIHGVPWELTPLAKPVGRKTCRASQNSPKGNATSKPTWEEHVQQSSSKIHWPTRLPSISQAITHKHDYTGHSSSTFYENGRDVVQTTLSHSSLSKPKPTSRDPVFKLRLETHETESNLVKNTSSSKHWFQCSTYLRRLEIPLVSPPATVPWLEMECEKWKRG